MDAEEAKLRFWELVDEITKQGIRVKMPTGRDISRRDVGFEEVAPLCREEAISLFIPAMEPPLPLPLPLIRPEPPPGKAVITPTDARFWGQILERMRKDVGCHSAELTHKTYIPMIKAYRTAFAEDFGWAVGLKHSKDAVDAYALHVGARDAKDWIK